VQNEIENHSLFPVIKLLKANEIESKASNSDTYSNKKPNRVSKKKKEQKKR